MLDLDGQLKNLLNMSKENEIIEFKEAKKSFDSQKLGKYFSALCNEANLMNKERARLIFGVKDSDHSIVNTEYKNTRGNLHKLKEYIGDKTTNRISFIEIYEVKRTEGRVIMFEIPPAPRGIPVAWDGHYYARDNESLQPLNIEKIERIRNQSTLTDWSAQICGTATLGDLDIHALKIARQIFISKNEDKKNEITQRDDETLLNKMRITIKGKITNTAILLLGKEESQHFLHPAIAKISRILKDRDGIEKDYEHFSTPFLLSAAGVSEKIRNLKYRYMKGNEFFPEEVDKYDPYIIREALNNCIVHQDYTLAGKINVIENEDSLMFTNSGSFIPETIENVIKNDAPSEFYRNRFLADAMINLKMIDTIGSGIKKMFSLQRKKYFPMPEYTIGKERVSVLIIGKVLDVNYANKLAQIPSLSLLDIMSLDKVQKKKSISKEVARDLKKRKLISGRKVPYTISLSVAQITKQVGSYINKAGLEKDKQMILIENYLEKQTEPVLFESIFEYISGQLGSAYSKKQKKDRLRYLLQKTKKEKLTIDVTGKGRYGKRYFKR